MDNNQQKQTQNRSSKPESAKQKFVVGTACTSSMGRKMRTPPADIFVWGLHPDTTVEDIVNDLASSDIKIEASDVERKSKDGAPRNSYRISVPATDLLKALDPSIWPLRVKAREYIYYSSKKKQQPNDSSKPETEPSVTPPAPPAPGAQSEVLSDAVPVYNMYDPLANLDGGNDGL